MSDQKERDEIMSDQRMEGSTPHKRRWTCPDTETSKALRRTLILEPKSGSPLLMLFLEEGGYRLYSPEEDRVYETKGEFSGYRFLANSGYCKKGDAHYREITTRDYKKGGVRRELEAIRLEGLQDMVLTGYVLYILSKRDFIRHLDLSGKDGFKDVSPSHTSPMWRPAGDLFRRDEETRKVSSEDKIAVTPSSSQKVLIVHTRVYESKATLKKHRSFQLYEKDSTNVDSRLLEVKCLPDEALFVDLGITVLADQTLGIELNSIYFSRGRRFSSKELSYLDICVYNLPKKTTKHFPTLSNLKLKDAQWFLPY